MRLPCRKKILKTVLIALTVFMSFSCTLRLGTIEPSDYGFTGFIDPHVFQALVTAKPDSQAQGLVNQRDSAYFIAAGKARDKAISELAEHIINEYSGPESTATATNRKLFLTPLIAELASGGIGIKPVFEYYLEDNSAVLGYRIHGLDLKKNGTALLKKLIDKKNNPGADSNEKK